MRTRCNFFGFLFLLLISKHALASPDLKVEATVSLNNSSEPRHITGSIELDSEQVRQRRCFYLPYNDPSFGLYTIGDRRLDFTNNKLGVIGFLGGNTTVSNNAKYTIKTIKPELIELELKSNDEERLVLTFSSVVPKLPAAENRDWFYNGFYPQLLERCPSAKSKSFDYTPLSFKNIAAQVKPLDEWTTVLPDGALRKEFVFAMVKAFKSKRLESEGTEIQLYYRSDNFESLIPTIQDTLKLGRRWLGETPQRQLLIVETSQLQRNDLPGIVAINEPQQAAFRRLQAEVLNWNRWTMVSMIVHQWFGASISAKHANDRWLIKGFADFVTLQILKQMPEYFDLVNEDVMPLPILSVNYRELQDMQAAILNRSEPKAVLTDDKFKSIQKYLDQSPLASIRQVIALRQIHQYVGTDHFAQIIAEFTKTVAFSTITPKDFHDYLTNTAVVPDLQATQAAKYLKQWWTMPGWPDEEILDFSSKRTTDGWVSRIEIKQNNPIGFPMSVKVEDDQEQTYYGLAEQGPDGTYVAEVKTTRKGVDATIDPNHSYFDEDRFNNTTKWPHIKFYPGDARRVADDDYTLLWFAYPFRRSGDPWSLAINAVLFRYLNSGLKIKYETEFGPRHRSSFDLKQRHDIPNYSLSTEVGAKQDLHGSRVIEAKIERNPFVNWGPKTGIYLGARARQVVGSAQSGHETGAIGFNINPWQRPEFCSYLVQGEYEAAPRETSKAFQYERRFAVAETYCPLFLGIDTRLRVFRGELTGQGQIPSELLFNPQDAEFAALRLDLSGLKNSRQIFSVNSDLFLPLILPVPEASYIVTRRLKLRLFYDYGRSMDVNTNYHAAGTGILLPFGGDISSVGTIAVTNFSFLAVLYSAAENRVSRQPRYLIDFSTDL